MGQDSGEGESDTLLTLNRRASVSFLEKFIKDNVESDKLTDAIPLCSLKHYFAPTIEEYGCGTYARELFMPAGIVLTGKIHRHAHITIVSQGKFILVSETGREEITAPHTFVSPVGAKRAFYVIEDTVLTTIHLTKHLSEDSLDDIEAEVIAPNYSSIGMEEPDVDKFEEELRKLEIKS